MCLRTVLWCSLPQTREDRGQCAPLDARSWSGRLFGPALVRSALSAASFSAAFRLFLHILSRTQHNCCVCGRSCWAPGEKKLPPSQGSVEAGSNRNSPGSFFYFFLSRGGIRYEAFAMRWTYQNVKWGASVFSASESLLTTGFLDLWRTYSLYSPWNTYVGDVEAASYLLYSVGAAVPVICWWKQSTELQRR